MSARARDTKRRLNALVERKPARQRRGPLREKGPLATIRGGLGIAEGPTRQVPGPAP